MEEMTVETALGVDGDGDVIMVDAAEAVKTNLEGMTKKNRTTEGIRHPRSNQEGGRNVADRERARPFQENAKGNFKKIRRQRTRFRTEKGQRAPQD